MSYTQHASNRTVAWVYPSVSPSHFCLAVHHFPTAFHQKIWIWTEFFLWNKAWKYLIAWLSLAWSTRAGYFTRCSSMPVPLHTFPVPRNMLCIERPSLVIFNSFQIHFWLGHFPFFDFLVFAIFSFEKGYLSSGKQNRLAAFSYSRLSL